MGVDHEEDIKELLELPNLKGSLIFQEVSNFIRNHNNI
jgi:hypothetical protein